MDIKEFMVEKNKFVPKELAAYDREKTGQVQVGFAQLVFSTVTSFKIK